MSDFSILKSSAIFPTDSSISASRKSHIAVYLYCNFVGNMTIRIIKVDSLSKASRVRALWLLSGDIYDPNSSIDLFFLLIVD